jgi:hypothetical protein
LLSSLSQYLHTINPNHIYNNNNTIMMNGGSRGSGGPLGKLSNVVTSGIGFAGEVRQYRKAQKVARKENESQQQENSPLSSTRETSRSTYSSPPPSEKSGARESSDAENVNERVWELDDAQDEVVGGPAPRKSKEGAANPDKVVAAFLQRQPPPYVADEGTKPVYKLEYPVVIPQRRPKKKERGFVRAYAPDLQGCGIDQVAWLDFIETLNEASLANPWINAVNLASFAFSGLPFLISTAVSMAIMVATQAAMEVQGRQR